MHGAAARRDGYMDVPGDIRRSNAAKGRNGQE